MRLSFEFANVLGSVYHRGSLTFSPDGSNIFSPVGNKVVVHDLKAGRSNSLPLQVNYNISKICVHPKNTIMIAASERNHLYIISLACGKMLHLKEYKTFSLISHVSFSPDGRYYCVAGDNLLLIYVTPGSLIAGRGREIVPFRLLKKFRVNHDNIVDVSWSADSEYICAASRDVSLNIISLHDRDTSFVQLRGHTDSIVGCYFANKFCNDRQLYSLTKNCQLFVWDQVEEDVDEQPKKRTKSLLKYHLAAKHYLKLAPEPDENKNSKVKRHNAHITSTCYNSSVSLLVIGYNTGHYALYELPSANLIYDLQSDYGSIDSLSINPSGDWIAIGSSVDPEVDIERGTNRTQSRLLVWEWQSKSHIFDQIGTGSTMTNMHECVSYSPDGSHIVSGNLAGRIKVWSGLTGETVASFGDEHKGPIKAIKFAPGKSGKVVISASLDGTLRAYDLDKFKNFRTFRSPVEGKFPEFTCLDIDLSGEFVAAGTYNYFEVYMFSLQTGKFLEYLSGHEGPVSGIAFSPMADILLTCSWDMTIRVWNIFDGTRTIRETIQLSHEAITLAFRPDGNQFAVSLSSGQILLFDPHALEQIGAPIEGASDLGTTQIITEISRETKKYFNSLSYSADGTYILAGGKSNFISIYHAAEKILIKKIALTFNLSMDGVFDYVSNRRRREFGYNLELLQERQEERSFKPIQLPGVRRGDLGERSVKPVIFVSQIVFSPTMRSFCAATTEGVLIYSLDISKHFDPYKLMVDVNPSTIRRAMIQENFGFALTQAIQLNDKQLLQEVLENVPVKEIPTIVASLKLDYVKRLLAFIGKSLSETRHLEFFIIWIKSALYKHGMALKNLSSDDTTSIIRTLYQNCNRHYLNLKKNGDFCRYSLEFLTLRDNTTSQSSEEEPLEVEFYGSDNETSESRVEISKVLLV